MKEQLGWFCAACLVAGAFVLAGTLIYSGCSYEYQCNCPPPCDGGLDDGGGDGDGGSEAWQEDWREWRTDSAPTSAILGDSGDPLQYQLGANYVTLEPGGSITLTASECTVTPEAEETLQAMDPPLSFYPCTYHWDFGDGQTAEGASPGRHTFGSAGFYTITMTASNAYGAPDLHPPTLHVAVWNGDFSDDFDRADGPVEDWAWDNGWGIPLSMELNISAHADWNIVDNRLRTEMADCTPAATGLVAWSEAQDVRMEVVQERDRLDRGASQFTDMLLRLNFHGPGATAPRYTFYRVRIREYGPAETPEHNAVTETHLDGAVQCVQIDIFRIALDNPFGEFGLNIRGGDGLVRTTQPVVCGWPREPVGHDFHIVVELTTNAGGFPRFDVVITDTDDPSRTLEEHIDDNPDHPDAPVADYDPDSPSITPLLGPGRFGITLCQFLTFFDDFQAESLD